jgi:hypothetical protein
MGVGDDDDDAADDAVVREDLVLNAVAFLKHPQARQISRAGVASSLVVRPSP